MQKGEFRIAVLGGVVSSALVGHKIGCRPTPVSSIDIVMLIGASIRQEV
jgi:hypothetical protein